MAYTFDGTGDILRNTSAVISGHPMTFACWVKGTPSGSFHQLVGIDDNMFNTALYSLYLVDDGMGNISVNAVEAESTGADEATSSSTYTDSGWHHACGIIASDSDRRAFLDGGNKGTNTNMVLAAAMPERTTIGGADFSGMISHEHTGEIAEVGIWDVALTDAEVASLGAGISPLSIRPASLVMYLPLIRELVEPVGAASFSAVGDAAVADHYPNMYYPRRINAFPGVAPVGGGGGGSSTNLLLLGVG